MAMMQECARVSRSFHSGSYLASLYIAPRLARAAALVLRALAGEVAAASRQSTPGLASLRIGFWKRAAAAALDVDGVGRAGGSDGGGALGDGSQAPVIVALRALSSELRLGESALARRRVLAVVENAPRCCGRGEFAGDAHAEHGGEGRAHVQTMNELEAMAEAVDGNILCLTNVALRPDDVHEFEHAASHIGKAVGIVRMVQNTPLLASERRSVLPTELCAKFGLVMVCLARHRAIRTTPIPTRREACISNRLDGTGSKLTNVHCVSHSRAHRVARLALRAHSQTRTHTYTYACACTKCARIRLSAACLVPRPGGRLSREQLRGAPGHGSCGGVGRARASGTGEGHEPHARRAHPCIKQTRAAARYRVATVSGRAREARVRCLPS